MPRKYTQEEAMKMAAFIRATAPIDHEIYALVTDGTQPPAKKKKTFTHPALVEMMRKEASMR